MGKRVQNESGRTNDWLGIRAERLRVRHLQEVAQDYKIAFGRSCYQRFGSVSIEDGHPKILINGLFADARVPSFVVDETIIHEFMHIAHGLLEPELQLHRYPHRGGVVERDMVSRGCTDILAYSKIWTCRCWPPLVASIGSPGARKAAKIDMDRWKAYLSQIGTRNRNWLKAESLQIARNLDMAANLPIICWIRLPSNDKRPAVRMERPKILGLNSLLKSPKVPNEVVRYELASEMVRRMEERPDPDVTTSVAILTDVDVNSALDWYHQSWRSHCLTHPLRVTSPRNTGAR